MFFLEITDGLAKGNMDKLRTIGSSSPLVIILMSAVCRPNTTIFSCDHLCPSLRLNSIYIMAMPKAQLSKAHLY